MAQVIRAEHSEEVKAALAKTLEIKRKKDRTLVRGIFRYHEVPGGMMEFNFKRYKKDPLEKFSLMDGEVATIPLGVAKHLNINCFYPSYTFKNDEAGRPQVSIGEKIRRCSFQSLEFSDMEDLSLETIESALPTK
jgi:hypothetical protein